MGYNGGSGNGTGALGNPYDPNKKTIYLDNDAMDAIDNVHSYGDRIPDYEFHGFGNRVLDFENISPDELLEFLITTAETSGNGRLARKAAKGTSNVGSAAGPIFDAKRFSRKGAIYYDSDLQHNIRRDTDSTGELTDLPAKDTLPGHY